MSSEHTWGGARPGAGRPRTRVTLHIPAWAMRQLEEIAEAEGTNVAGVVHDALLDWISAWQAEHDSTHVEAGKP
jgi:hypothetical protein